MADPLSLPRLGAALLVAATAGLLLAWPGWRLSDAPPKDAYAMETQAFLTAAQVFADRHRVGERVRPPPGADVPVVARRFQFWPDLELQAGQTYRLHVAAVDVVHSVVVQGRELALVPGQVRVVDITPSAGDVVLQCGEYCGLGHNRMRGTATVIP